MKYHTTISNSITSLVILIAVVLSVLVMGGMKVLPDFTDALSESIVQRLSGDGTRTVGISSIDASLFSDIVLNDIKVADGSGDVVVSIGKLTIDVPAYGLIWNRLLPKRIGISMEQVDASVDQNELLQWFSNEASAGESFPLDPLLSGRTIMLEMQGTSLAYSLEDLVMSIDGFDLYATIADGILSEASLDANRFLLGASGVEAAAKNPSIAFGSTVAEGRGLRLVSDSVEIAIPNQRIAFSAESMGASLVSPSLSELLSLDGDVVLTAEGGLWSVGLGDDVLRFQSDTFGVDGTLVGGSLGLLELGIPKANLTYGSWELLLDSTEALLSLGDDTLEASLRSPGSYILKHELSPLVRIETPNVAYSMNTLFEQVQFDAANIVGSSIEHIGKLLDYNISSIESLATIDPYILAIRNRNESSLTAETSFDIEMETKLPFLPDISGQVSGSIAFDRQLVPSDARLFLGEFTSGQLDGSIDASVAYRAGEDIDFSLTHTNGIELVVDHRIAQESSRVSLRLDDMKPYRFLSVVEKFSPTVAALLAPETSLQGNINMTIANDLENGRGTAEIGIANLAVDEQRFNLATTFTGSLDSEVLSIDLATLTTEGYRLSYIGSMDRTRLFPEGTLTISDVESGEEMVSADFNRLSKQSYQYRITSPSMVGSSLDGDVSWSERGDVNARGVLSVPKATYPLTINYAFDEGRIILGSEDLTASLDFTTVPGHIAFGLETDALALPPITSGPLSGRAFVTGTIAADFSLAEELFIINSPSLLLEGLSWRDEKPFSLRFALDADSRELRLHDMLYEDAAGPLRGYLTISNRSLLELTQGVLFDFSALADVRGAGRERISISFDHDETDRSTASGVVSLQDFNVGRFPWFAPDAMADFVFVGKTDLSSLMLGHASASLASSADTSEWKTDLHFTESGIMVSELSFERGTTRVAVERAALPYEGESSVSLSARVESPLVWRDGDTSGKAEVTFGLPASTDFFSWLDNLPTSLEMLPELKATHSDVSLYGMVPWKVGTHIVRFSDDSIIVDKGDRGTLSGSYNYRTGYLDVLASEGFPIPMRAFGTVGNGKISLMMENIRFDLKYLNAIFAEPIITFQKGKAFGNLLIDGSLDDPDYYGTLKADSIDVTTFWTVGESFSLKNPVMTVSEHSAVVAASPVSAVHESGRRTTGTIQMEFTVEQWGFPHYRIDILEITDPISIWIPIPDIDVNIETMVSGSFSIDGYATEETLYGDVTVSEGKISFGVPELPIWFVPKTRTNIDMTLRTGRNVSFIFPNEESPIIRATFADGQELGLSVKAPSMVTTFAGELAFRSGEIYYVQKNFYITEGSLRFPTRGIGLDSDFLPRLNLRARLREFEPDGTRVDIFMVLQDARFDDLNPRFESIPLRSTNEILELLGQNIVTAGSARESGLTSVVAVASAATDVISRLGILQNTTISLGFSSIIRESLGLDVFTIRTNLLQNILFDALPGVVADTTVSPIARYLDNTTMYIGKYLLEDFYLQGMLHFRRASIGGVNSFLTNDLRIDTELSVEWTNPLATFSFFTQPEELSVFDLFDTMGFSITKRFEF